MLYLTRKVGESILINDDIEVTVVEVRGRSIKLGFTFPAGVSVLRRELFEKIRRENLEAAQADPSLLEVELPADGHAADPTDTPERRAKQG
jgi:carbon storage regulator